MKIEVFSESIPPLHYGSNTPPLRLTGVMLKLCYWEIRIKIALRERLYDLPLVQALRWGRSLLMI
jgi:hypothetical protein